MKMKKREKEKGTFQGTAFPLLLLLPAMTGFIVFVLYPFVKNIYLTFFITDNLGNPGAYVGWKNYIRVLNDKAFWNSLKVTFKFAAVVGSGSFLLSMFLAIISIDMGKGHKVYQTMFALPMAIASVPVSSIAMYILSQYGLLNHLLGTNINWLSDKNTAIYAVAAVTIWSGAGTSFLYLLVGFRNVPDDLVEAATLDGAGFFQKVTKIYIPIASPQIFFVMFLNILGSFKAFGYIHQLTGRGPNNTTNVLIYNVYVLAFARGRFETACVYAIILALIIFIVTRIQLLLEKRMVHYQ